MPIYEYACEKCQHQFELLIRSNNHKPECPQCGSTKLARLFSTFAAHAGSGSQVSPCQSGRCPAGASAASACSSGNCPFSS